MISWNFSKWISISFLGQVPEEVVEGLCILFCSVTVPNPPNTSSCKKEEKTDQSFVTLQLRLWLVNRSNIQHPSWYIIVIWPRCATLESFLKSDSNEDQGFRAIMMCSISLSPAGLLWCSHFSLAFGMACLQLEKAQTTTDSLNCKHPNSPRWLTHSNAFRLPEGTVKC